MLLRGRENKPLNTAEQGTITPSAFNKVMLRAEGSARARFLVQVTSRNLRFHNKNKRELTVTGCGRCQYKSRSYLSLAPAVLLLAELADLGVSRARQLLLKPKAKPRHSALHSSCGRALQQRGGTKHHFHWEPADRSRNSQWTRQHKTF